jgi:tricarballylate dehydrogenase
MTAATGIVWLAVTAAPPYYGIALRPGITFTYLGVRVDESARVLDAGGRPLGRVFAAGEIMSGNILSSGYLAGFGVTIGHVWGRIAGEAAAGA